MPTFNTLLSITAIALLQPVLGTITGCDNPGDHMCSVITAGGAFGNPVTGAISGSRYVDVGDGSCNSILSSGKLEPQSPGFYADLKTVYGTEIQYWADSVSVVLSLFPFSREPRISFLLAITSIGILAYNQ